MPSPNWNDCLCQTCLLDGRSCDEMFRATRKRCCPDCCHPTLENLQVGLYERLIRDLEEPDEAVLGQSTALMVRID